MQIATVNSATGRLAFAMPEAMVVGFDEDPDGAFVGGVFARGADPLTALLWRVWLHGEAGPRLARRIGTLGFLARERADEVPGLLDRFSPLRSEGEVAGAEGG